MELARNRKQRRDAESFDPSAIPLAHPDITVKKKNGKTLVEMIAERNGGILPDEKSEGSSDMGSRPGTRFVTVDPATGEISGFDPDFKEEGEEEEGEKKDTEGEEDGVQDQPLPAFLDTILLSFPLATLHLTLAYLAAYQYAAEIPISHLVRESALVAFPILTLLIHLAHGHIISFGRADEDAAENTADKAVLFPLTSEKLSLSFFRQLVFPPTTKTLVFLPLSILLGVKLMAVTNQAPYYAVMKRAPAIGTLWVWTILEVPFGASVVGALGPLCWGVWWEGYGLF